MNRVQIIFLTYIMNDQFLQRCVIKVQHKGGEDKGRRQKSEIRNPRSEVGRKKYILGWFTHQSALIILL
ncbi:MAG: hypothetical protein C4330_12105 [Chitinophagaceae bacterium]